MKNTLFAALVLIISTQAFAGTAYVIYEGSNGTGKALMYNAPDCANCDDMRSDISICDNDFTVFKDFNVVGKYNPDANTTRYKDINSNCEITVSRTETEAQVVKVVSGAGNCKININGKLESIENTYGRD